MGLTAQIEKLYSQVRVNSYSATPEFITYLTQYMASLIEVKIRMREWKLQAGAAQLGLVYEKPSCARSRNALPTPSKYSQTSAIIVTSKCQVLDSGTFDQHYWAVSVYLHGSFHSGGQCVRCRGSAVKQLVKARRWKTSHSHNYLQFKSVFANSMPEKNSLSLTLIARLLRPDANWNRPLANMGTTVSREMQSIQGPVSFFFIHFWCNYIVWLWMYINHESTHHVRCQALKQTVRDLDSCPQGGQVELSSRAATARQAGNNTLVEFPKLLHQNTTLMSSSLLISSHREDIHTANDSRPNWKIITVVFCDLEWDDADLLTVRKTVSPRK